jgi:hypothetical protein
MSRVTAIREGHLDVFADHWRRARIIDPRDSYRDPRVLQEACLEYFEWNANSPIVSEDVFSTKQAGVAREKVYLHRTMSIRALCLRIGIPTFLWRDWRRECPIRRPVVLWAEDVIYAIKLEAASSEMINPMIAVRELGLRDGHEVTGLDGDSLILQVDPKDVLVDRLTRILAAKRDSTPHL